ncbi:MULTISPECIES: efflux transporter outer membrane subunit [unclassified Methylophilus]|uniref:efflux transporter outer membrane subunit n=1 Tax=unclassified Methylophilus TaxID=2630143 RepID=UPI0007003273|nr:MULTISPECIES: efflux transporter outer membrane subunit [unclassified Methylophilus]KQT41713.1 multidrug transporter [Methylophilus sp. Leaf416]KQT55880.1 multidrug transporter [Methylophilus sp. Leaf459]
MKCSRIKGQLAAGVALVFALSSCSLVPEYFRPPAPVPEAYPGQPASDAVTEVPPLTWQSYFPDTDLQKLIQVALEHNRDLKTAVLRMDEAKATYGIQKADRLPTIQGNLAYDRSRTVFSSSQAFEAELFRVGVGISEYEVDIFGRVKSLSQAALEQYLAVAENRQAIQASLVTEIATQYVNLLTIHAQLKLAQQTLDDRKQTLQRTQRRFDAGLDQILDVKSAQIQVEQVQAQYAQWQRQLETTKNALYLLLGEPSQRTALIVKPLEALRLGNTPAGLPSTLLTRRADIRAAEHQLKAANANIGAARAAFYPRLQLTTNVGLVNSDFSKLFTQTGSNYWAFSPQLVIPIFNYGRNKANLNLAEARQHIEVVNYEKTIQTAFKEVMDVLSTRTAIEEESAARTRLNDLESSRLQLVKRKLDQGLVTYLELLDAQRSVLDAQAQALQIRQLALQNQVSLYKALGGS